MQIITLYKSKGGAGRASTILAVASGFLFHEKRVLLIDVGSRTGSQSSEKPPPLIERWKQWIAQNLTCSADLTALACPSPTALPQLLAQSRSYGVEVVLIDARATGAPMQKTAVANSDIVVSSALRAEDARDAIEAVPLSQAQKRKKLGFLFSTPDSPGFSERDVLAQSLPLVDADMDALDVVVGQLALDDIAYHSDALDFSVLPNAPVGYGPARIACGAIITRSLPFNPTTVCGLVYLSPRGNLFKAFPLGTWGR